MMLLPFSFPRRRQLHHACLTILAILSTCWLGNLPCAFAQGGATAATNLSGQLQLSPSHPNDQWPPAGSAPQAGDLSPNYTATISVNITSSGSANGINYTERSGSYKAQGMCPDPRAIWVGTAQSGNSTSGTNTFHITNTAPNDVNASLSATCVWVPNGGGGGKGGGGSSPPNITGNGNAAVKLLKSVVVWNIQNTLQCADGQSTLSWSAAFYDEDYRTIKVNVNSVKPDPNTLSPSSATWNVQISSGSQGSVSTASGTVASNDGSVAKLQILYNDGASETNTSSTKLTFFDLDLQEIDFTSDHNVMTDYDTDFTGTGGNLYNPRGWKEVQDGQPISNPITHSQGETIHANLIVVATPAGVSFDINGACSDYDAFSFQAKGNTSTGSAQTISVTGSDNLAPKIDDVDETISWTAKAYSGSENVTKDVQDTEHEVYVLWDTPVIDDEPTRHRVDQLTTWASQQADVSSISNGIGTNTAGASSVNGLHFNGSLSAFGNPPYYKNVWAPLDGTNGADCITLCTLMKSAMDMIGVTGSEVWFVFPRHASWTGLASQNSFASEYRDSNNSNTVLLYGAQNNFEACCKFQGVYWMGGENGQTENTALAVLYNCVGQPNNNQQYYKDQPNVKNISYPNGNPPTY